MFIVYIGKHKHSAWNSRHEAKHQIDVLASYGYKRKNIWLDDVDANYSNGQYFV